LSSLPLPEFEAAKLRLGPNDSSINRGDREDTGDNEAQPDEMGSGPAHPTVDPTSFGGTTSISHSETDSSAIEEEVREDDGFEIEDATDGRLGLTGIGNHPAEDWAADTGPTRTPESD
jgi:hypothetical protein